MKNLTVGRRTVSRGLTGVAALLLGTMSLATSPAFAQQEVEVETDARLEGYQGDMKVENDSTALAWLFFIFLAVIGISPLFKDAKRTHLD